jgi:hypothetical protein
VHAVVPHYRAAQRHQHAPRQVLGAAFVAGLGEQRVREPPEAPLGGATRRAWERAPAGPRLAPVQQWLDVGPAAALRRRHGRDRGSEGGLGVRRGHEYVLDMGTQHEAPPVRGPAPGDQRAGGGGVGLVDVKANTLPQQPAVAGRDVTQPGEPREERRHLVAQRGIARTFRVEPRAARRRLVRERAIQQRLDAAPAPRRGGRHAPSSRLSQARAIVQSRFTVAGEMSSASAVSSTLMPPKKRHSTTRAARASCRASRSSASSSVSSSSPRGGHHDRIVEGLDRSAATALLRATRNGPVDEDVAHGARRDGEGIGAPGPARVVELRQLDVRLVHQRRGAERVPGLLAAQVAVRDAPQLLVHGGRHVVERGAGPRVRARVGARRVVAARGRRVIVGNGGASGVCLAGAPGCGERATGARRAGRGYAVVREGSSGTGGSQPGVMSRPDGVFGFSRCRPAVRAGPRYPLLTWSPPCRRFPRLAPPWLFTLRVARRSSPTHPVAR